MTHFGSSFRFSAGVSSGFRNMMQQTMKRRRNSGWILQETGNLTDYCKELTIDSVNSDDNSWVNRICREKLMFADQIPFIVMAIEATEKDYEKFMETYKTVELTTMRHFKDKLVSVKPFGSAITKLALKGSDIDLAMDFGDKLPMPLKGILHLTSKLLKSSKRFNKVITIFAKVPIVRCMHINGVSCDISFQRKFITENTKLLSFFVSLDSRVRDLVMMVKFIFKRKGLLDAPGFRSYGLAILLIYYLQQLPTPILPSVSYLQSQTPDRVLHEGWNMSFMNDASQVPQVTNSKTVPELLHGFFKMCTEFEFGMYVLSPFLGKCFLRPLFAKTELLPPEFDLYKEHVAKNPDENALDMSQRICVQDMFVHSNNVTKNIAGKYLTIFDEICASFAKTFEEESRSPFFFSNFLEMSPISKKRKKMEGKEQPEQQIVIYLSNCSMLEFDEGEEITEESVRNKWADSITSIVRSVIDEVMKCEIEKGEATGRVFKCKMERNVMSPKKRQEARKEKSVVTPDQSIRDEALVSEYIYNSMSGFEKVNVPFQIGVKIKAKPTRAIIDLVPMKTLNNHSERECFIHILNFFEKSFPRLIDNSMTIKRNSPTNNDPKT